MNNPAQIERWLIEGTVEDDPMPSADLWEADFDEGRQLVVRDFGFYHHVYLRPKKFVKRFYHTLYPLPVENWRICEQIQLYDEFCTIDAQLDIRFQATLEYAQNQLEDLAGINEHIKNTCHQSISDRINKYLLSLKDNDEWVPSGLGDIEKAIAITVSEMLMIENIETQAYCSIRARFLEFPDVHLGKEAMYLSVMKKSYEVSEAQREEHLRQQQEKQQKQLQQYKQDAELNRHKQAQDAEQQQQLLLDQTLQQQQQFAIEVRLHTDKTKHDSYLNDITLDVQLQAEQEQKKRSRSVEQKLQAEALSHQTLLKNKKLQVGIERFEHEKAHWLEVKDKVHTLALKKQQQHQRQKLEMETAYKKHEKQLQTELLEYYYNNTANSDIYLRREIELLELDKRRLELRLAIKEKA